MRIEEKLKNEVLDELDELESMNLGSDEYHKTVEGITKLTDRVIEMEKVASERDKIDIQKRDIDLKEQQHDDEKKDRRTQKWLTVAGLVLPLAVTVWGTITSLNFEKTGTVTTGIGRGFINKLLPKNK